MLPEGLATGTTASSGAATCGSCHAPIHRSSQKFCTTCGADLRKQAVSVAPAQIRADPSLALRGRLDHRRALKSVREGYFELGLQLLDDKRHREALQAFEQALDEKGASPERLDVLVAIAQASEGAGEPARALRACLETVTEGFDPAEIALLQAARHLSPAAAQVHGAWVTTEWARISLGRLTDARDRARVHAFLGVVESCMGLEDDAMSSFRGAAAAHAAEAREAASDFLLSATLPANRIGDSLDAHYFRARVF